MWKEEADRKELAAQEEADRKELAARKWEKAAPERMDNQVPKKEWGGGYASTLSESKSDFFRGLVLSNCD